MEFYDTFDENGVFLCAEDEHDVHYKGLWHKVIRVWLYDKEGNLYLRVRKEDNKLDCINELHMRSSESVSSCFDRGMFEKLGIHFPATSNLEQACMKKVKVYKVYSDNSELKDNYFLCDYIGEFDKNTSFFIYSKDTAGLVKVNAKGILTLLDTRAGEIVSEEVLPGGRSGNKKELIHIEDIYENPDEDTFAKYNNVVNKISDGSRAYEKERKEKEKIMKILNRPKTEEKIISHADENEGSDIY